MGFGGGGASLAKILAHVGEDPAPNIFSKEDLFSLFHCLMTALKFAMTKFPEFDFDRVSSFWLFTA